MKGFLSKSSLAAYCQSSWLQEAETPNVDFEIVSSKLCADFLPSKQLLGDLKSTQLMFIKFLLANFCKKTFFHFFHQISMFFWFDSCKFSSIFIDFHAPSQKTAEGITKKHRKTKKKIKFIYFTKIGN